LGTGCAPAPDDTTIGDTHREPLADIRVGTHGCDIAMDSKLVEAYALIRALNDPWGRPLTNFLSCLQAAPLVETLGVMSGQSEMSADDCRGHAPETAGMIWQALMSYSVSNFSCDDLNPTPSMDGSIVVGLAGPNSNEVEVLVDRNWLPTASARQVAAVLLHEMSHNLGFQHTAHEFGDTLSPLTVPYQVQACMARGVPNPAPAGFPNMAAICATNPRAAWGMTSVSPSSAAALANAGSWASIDAGPFSDDSWFTSEGPAATWLQRQ
jgi:hypothetical protein